MERLLESPEREETALIGFQHATICTWILFIVFCTWCCGAHRFHLPRHFFIRNPPDHLVLYDKSNSSKPLNFDIRLRYVWGQNRLVIVDSLFPEKVLYKVICRTTENCDILGWTRNRTNVTVVASLNTMALYPYPKRGDPEFYNEGDRDEADDLVKSLMLLEKPLLISTELFDELLNVTFYPSQRKYTIAYGTRRIVAEIENFGRSTPQSHLQEDYSLWIFQHSNPTIDPSFLISICMSIDFIQWPYYLSAAYFDYKWNWNLFFRILDIPLIFFDREKDYYNPQCIITVATEKQNIILHLMFLVSLCTHHFSFVIVEDGYHFPQIVVPKSTPKSRPQLWTQK